MRGFICVYLHPRPKSQDLVETKMGAKDNPLLREYLEKYENENCYYDWGDDPAFFAATKLFGRPEFASWGVCRRDVREQLGEGHLVVFFCARPTTLHKNGWNYFYIGFATVGKVLRNRLQIWEDGSKYAEYRQFLNILVSPDKNGNMVQNEIIYPFHKDWQKRISAPYIIFEPELGKTHFNLINPLFVASYIRGNPTEKWNSTDHPLVSELKTLLFDQQGINRSLRIKNRLAHRHISMPKGKDISDTEQLLTSLREELYKISQKVLLH